MQPQNFGKEGEKRRNNRLSSTVRNISSQENPGVWNISRFLETGIKEVAMEYLENNDSIGSISIDL